MPREPIHKAFGDPDDHPANHRTDQTLDPTKDYGGKRDQGNAKRMIPSDRREVKRVEFPASARKRAANEKPERDGTGGIDAYELGADDILTNSPN